MKKLEEKDVPLLSRKRIIYEVEHTGAATPKKEDIKKRVAQDLRVDEGLIIIRHIYPHFGVEKAKVIVNVYKDKKDLEKFEKINKKAKKDGKKEKTKEQKTK